MTSGKDFLGALRNVLAILIILVDVLAFLYKRLVGARSS